MTSKASADLAPSANWITSPRRKLRRSRRLSRKVATGVTIWFSGQDAIRTPTMLEHRLTRWSTSQAQRAAAALQGEVA